MAVNYQFSSNFAGRQAYVPKGLFSLIIDNDMPYFGQVSAEIDGETYDSASVRLTGWSITKNGSTYYQDVNGYWALWSADAQLSSSAAPGYSSSATYKLINGLINNNKHILENNLLCAKYADKLSISERQRLFDLQTRLQNRDTMLRNKNIMESVTTSYPKGYASWSGYLDAFMSNGRVGAIGTIAVIVVSVIVIASLISAAYWAYKYYYDESVTDVKYSDALTKTLASKLTAQEYEQLKQETAGMITKAKLSARLSSIGSYAKYVLYGFAGFLVYKVATKNQ